MDWWLALAKLSDNRVYDILLIIPCQTNKEGMLVSYLQLPLKTKNSWWLIEHTKDEK